MENNIISSNPKFKYDVKLVGNDGTNISVGNYDTEEEALAKMSKHILIEEGIDTFKIDMVDVATGEIKDYITTTRRF